MDKTEIRNAVVEYTHLGYQWGDHGVLTYSIGLNYGDSGYQGFGTHVLDTTNPARREPGQPPRLPTLFAGGMLWAVDQIFGCDWENLKGKPCRALATFTHITALGHYLEDKWMWVDKMGFHVTPLADVPRES
mgnify:CR=1 FL=1